MLKTLLVNGKPPYFVTFFRLGLYYSTSIVNRDIALKVQWPNSNWCEDHKFYEALVKMEGAKKLRQTMDCYYVVRRHNEGRYETSRS